MVTVRLGKSLSRKSQRERKMRWNTHRIQAKAADGLKANEQPDDNLIMSEK